MSLILYYHPLSQPSRAVNSLLLFGDIQAERKFVDIPKETRSPEFAKINPFKTVPVIQDKDFVLFESHAILRYLCRVNPSLKSFYPEDPVLAAKVDEYLDWHHTGNRAQFATYWRITWGGPKFFGFPEPTAEVLLEQTQRVSKALDEIENIFLGGDKKFKYINNLPDITIADLRQKKLMKIISSCLNEITQLITCNFNYSNWPNVMNWIFNLLQNPKIREASSALFDLAKKSQPTPNDFIKSLLQI